MAAIAQKSHYSREEVARRWGISVRTVDQAIADGRLRVVRFGRAVRLPVALVEQIDVEGFPSK